MGEGFGCVGKALEGFGNVQIWRSGSGTSGIKVVAVVAWKARPKTAAVSLLITHGPLLITLRTFFAVLLLATGLETEPS